MSLQPFKHPQPYADPKPLQAASVNIDIQPTGVFRGLVQDLNITFTYAGGVEPLTPSVPPRITYAFGGAADGDGEVSPGDTVFVDGAAVGVNLHVTANYKAGQLYDHDHDVEISLIAGPVAAVDYDVTSIGP